MKRFWFANVPYYNHNVLHGVKSPRREYISKFTKGGCNFLKMCYDIYNCNSYI